MSESSSYLSRSLSRRELTLAAAAAGIGIGFVRPQFSYAQAADLTALGLPTLDITADDVAYTGVPETLVAGRYLLNFTVTDTAADDASVTFLSPYGMSADEFLAFLGLGGDSNEEEASPAAEESEGDEEDDSNLLPAFVYQSIWAGGIAGVVGTTSAVIDLTPGEWLAWAGDPSGPLPPVPFTVTGDFPDPVATPESDVTFELVDFAITVSGNLTAGEHTVLVQNNGAQPHFVDLMSASPKVTIEDLTAYVNSSMTGAVLDLDYDIEVEMVPVAYTPPQSIGTSTWQNMTFEAGNYAAMCWFPTAGVGDPHAVHGMYTIFTVS